MPFFCDHDVDEAAARALRRLGHDVWTAGKAHLALRSDDDHTVYADEKHAVLVTHDREFSIRRRRNVVGQHIWLRCDEEQGPEVITRYMPELVPLLERGHDLWIELRPNGIAGSSRRWE